MVLNKLDKNDFYGFKPQTLTLTVQKAMGPVVKELIAFREGDNVTEAARRILVGIGFRFGKEKKKGER
jgi:hypothetical protein